MAQAGEQEQQEFIVPVGTEALSPDVVLHRIKAPTDHHKTLRTPQRAVAIVTALKVGSSRKAACALAGIVSNTLWRWMADDPEMEKLVIEAEGAAELRFVTAVSGAANTSWQAAAWWLERRRPATYGKRDRLDVNIEARTLAEDLAVQEGFDKDEILAEAQRVMSVHRERQQRDPEE